MKIEIIKATTPEHLNVVRKMFEEYQIFLGFSLCFQGFDEELAKLPGKYAEPDGTILLAVVDEEFAGVVALWKLSEGVCEMKRLYVKPSFKGLGLGRKLAETIIAEAQQKGYQTMNLDTLKRLEEANILYKKLDFQRIEPYNYNPEGDVLYYAKAL